MDICPEKFVPFHCSVKPQDTEGRYFIVPGCPSRAKMISDKYLENVVVRPSPRGHNAYLGTIKGTQVSVGVVATGMGCPSIDIIITELIQLGAKYLIRLGTAGSFDLEKYPVGSLVIATGAVRDEATSKCYAPREFPAVPSSKIQEAFLKVKKQRKDTIHMGLVHTKDSLYAREFFHFISSKRDEHTNYMDTLRQLGVVASEMEAAHLFVLGSVYGVHTGCVCTLVGGTKPETGSFSEDPPKPNGCVVANSISFVMSAIKELYNDRKM